MRPLASFTSLALAAGLTATALFGLGQQPAASLTAGGSVAHAQAAGFVETFTGRPAGPTAYRPAGWDVVTHSRDVSTWDQPESMLASHGADCSAHPAQHQVASYADTIFQCNDHLMTAMQAGGYGAIYLTPSQQIDFSGGEATLRFDLSTLRLSHRDWVDIWVTPFEDNVPAPLDNWLPDLTGLPKRAIHLRMDTSSGATIFRADVIRNFGETALPSNWWTGYESFLTPSGVRRDTFELKLSKTSLAFGMPGYTFSWVDAQFPALDWTRGVVQLSHHSYNPLKDCDMASCAANTWHWDNVQINPAVPFTTLAGDRAAASASSPTVTFATPAPAGSYLRFLGIGSGLQISLDGGAWQSVSPRQTVSARDEAFKPYWVAVPAGTRAVAFRGSDWWGGPWRTNGVAIWSESGPGGASGPGVTSTPAATSTMPPATATPTAAPATSTPTTPPATPTTAPVTPTSTATRPPATPTATVPAATATATAPATATPSTPPAPGGNGSIKLTGNVHATVPHAPELALAGDWTAELWFKDEYSPSATFNHAPQALLMAGDTDWDADIPLMAGIEWGSLVVGDRNDWANQQLRYDLTANGVAPGGWHHLAVSKAAATRRVQIVLDGRLVAEGTLSGRNPTPSGKGLTIGRNGRQHNWRGKLDDIRIWSVVRSVSEIGAAYRAELSTTPAGLVANWKLNETAGLTAADSAGSPRTATVQNARGLPWSTEVHP
ncbi:MAG: LamG domain-containing protein [Chloroflexi bacterium]|nr:LamG domain-containing protein [Chloroflexota bacterium]